MIHLRRLLPLAAVVMSPGMAFAHTGVGETAGFAHGFAHPMSGPDHVLAMVMVGVLAWQIGGRALWLVPATFVLVMALGGAAGMAGIGLPFAEIGIALSVIVLGAIIAFGSRPPVAVAMGMVGLFAVFHGHAHGVEMPESAGGLAYAGGFMLATAILHVAGIAMGFAIGKLGDRFGQGLVRAAGGVAAVAGVALLTGTL